MAEERSKELILIKKAQKDYPTFTDSVDGLQVADLEKHLLRNAKYREETVLAKSKDEEIEQLKKQIKELSAPYNDALKALKVKLAYLNVIIQDKKAE